VHTHTNLTAPFPGLPWWAGTKQVQPIWTLLKQETVCGSGISWATCKSVPRSWQITMRTPHHSYFLQAGCPSCRPINSIKALLRPLGRREILKCFLCHDVYAFVVYFLFFTCISYSMMAVYWLLLFLLCQKLYRIIADKFLTVFPLRVCLYLRYSLWSVSRKHFGWSLC